jgi:hypothetical protein
VAQAGKRCTTKEGWWDPAQAVIFLRDGTTPTAAEIDWWPLPSAVEEIRRLNTAIQAGNIDMIELLLDGSRHRLKVEDKVCLELRFQRSAFYGDLGVSLKVFDTHTKKRRPIKTLLLRAEDVRALREANRSVSRSKKRNYQQDRLDAPLKTLYPPNGVVPDDVSTAVVHQRVAKALKDECQKLGIEPPSYDSVARKLRRKK